MLNSELFMENVPELFENALRMLHTPAVMQVDMNAERDKTGCDSPDMKIVEVQYSR
jgi:hypothetical protein